MKKYIYSALLLLSGLSFFTACSDDSDVNDELKQPDTFVLNEPAYSSSLIDLENSEYIHLTTSQPDYGFTAAVRYMVQVSLTNTWTTSLAEAEADESGATVADYATIDDSYTTVDIYCPSSLIAIAVEKLAGWSSASDLPAEQTVYVRLQASLVNYATSVDTNYTYSNVVTLNMCPYYIELVSADPILWYLTGSCIGNGGWGSEVPLGCFPLQMIKDYTYGTDGSGEIEWTGYLTTGGFKLRGATDDNWQTQIGQGDSFGSWLVNDGGSGNITVPADGYYTVHLNTTSLELTIEEYTESVKTYEGMALSGSFNDWSDTAMEPVHTAAAENHDWYLTIDLTAGTEFKFKQAGTWDFNIGGSLVTLNSGAYGYGTVGGDNIVVPADGTYMIIFNDLTGYYRLILQ